MTLDKNTGFLRELETCSSSGSWSDGSPASLSSGPFRKKVRIGERDQFCSIDHSLDLASFPTLRSKRKNVEPDRSQHPGDLARTTIHESVENSPRMVNQLTKASEILPSVVDQLTTLANQEILDDQSPVVNHNESINSGPDRTAKDESHFKSRKERKLKGIRISAEKLHKYELWCFINKIDFQDAVEKALDWLTSGQPVNHVLIDDLDDDDKNNKLPSSSAVENIAAFYREWTRNTVSEEDIKAIQEISSLDPNTIKLGIITAIYRKASSKGTRKINSFRYFFGTIREVANSKLGGSITLQRLEQVISLLLKTKDNHQPMNGRSE